MPRHRIAIIVLISIICILWAIKSVMELELYTTSVILRREDNPMNILIKKNTMLSNEILERQSLRIIKQEALDMGFVQGTWVFLSE